MFCFVFQYPFAVAGFALCTTLLVAYCVYQLLVPKLAKRRVEINVSFFWLFLCGLLLRVLGFVFAGAGAC